MKLYIVHFEDDSIDMVDLPRTIRNAIRLCLDSEADQDSLIFSQEKRGQNGEETYSLVKWSDGYELHYYITRSIDDISFLPAADCDCIFLIDAMRPSDQDEMMAECLEEVLSLIASRVVSIDRQVRVFTAFGEIRDSINKKNYSLPVKHEHVILKSERKNLERFILSRLGFD